MTTNILKQHPNTNDVNIKNPLITYIRTQFLHFPGTPLFQATKQHLSNDKTVKYGLLIWFWLWCFDVHIRSPHFISADKQPTFHFTPFNCCFVVWKGDLPRKCVRLCFVILYIYFYIFYRLLCVLILLPPKLVLSGNTRAVSAVIYCVFSHAEVVRLLCFSRVSNANIWVIRSLKITGRLYPTRSGRFHSAGRFQTFRLPVGYRLAVHITEQKWVFPFIITQLWVAL